MFRTAASLMLVLASTTAFGQSRPSTTGMTCSQARTFISARGAAVIGTGGQTYDRFVRDRSFCEPTEVTKTTFVPTRDNPQCFIGYRCIEPGRDDWFGDDF
jgi:hypothetical protein